jgi:phenylalanyl-tRNA synthetase beta chain
MKISLEWLNEYVDLKGLEALHISEILSNRGLPAESITGFGDDTVIDIEVTSNRGDCLGYIGIARELAAATGRHIKMPSADICRGDQSVGEFVDVEIAEPG